MKRIFSVVFSILLTSAVLGQTKTPGDFLGYKYGSKFTPHHRVVDYFEHLAQNNPNRTKLIQYGFTNEGRPLVVLVICSPANFSKLDEIRQNNLKSIGLLEGSPTAKPISIAWFSYNVHGNESCATTAAIPTAHDLLDENNQLSKKILSNTIVILDPCINPDGYDRYVNWYNQKVGKSMNVNAQDWQHNEPWPGGRFNHYGFDLNRDWAWQTQVETKQRLKLYQQWMPHMHVDFHEQGINSPYYFPPSAKPFHEDITAWQREMQNVVGEYQRKAFDKNNWLYFTKESFDLFYPSYGDTYPTYNGAIAYTLEQGGSGRAGLGIIDYMGDTLTLEKRYTHHYASGFAGLEAISNNSEKVVDEFVKFYENGKTNPKGEYKTFLIRSNNTPEKLSSFLSLLDKQQIKYGTAGKKVIVANAYSYQDRKNVGLNIESNDILISMYQPKSLLTKILLEPKSSLEDSVTYDITSWALPYAYGLEAFGIKEKLTPIGTYTKSEQTENSSIDQNLSSYAYVYKWKSIEDVKVLTQLLNKKIKVKFAEKAFEIDGIDFDAGSLIVTKGENSFLGNNFDRVLSSIKSQFTRVKSGYVTKGYDFGSGNVNYLKAPKIALIGGDGASPTGFGDLWYFFEESLSYPLTVITSEQISANSLKEFDVLIMPDGSFGRSINEKGLGALKDWIKNGGRMVAVGGANGFLAGKDDFELKSKKDDKKKDEKNENEVKIYADRERESVSSETPGSIYELTLENTHPLAFGYGKKYHSLVLEASDYAFLKDGWNVGYTTKNSYVAGFVGEKAKEKLDNSLMLGVQEMGRGKVIYMVNNPIFRNFWENGKLLLSNAVFMTN